MSSVEKLVLKMMKMGVTKPGAISILETLSEEQLNEMAKSDTALKAYIDETYFHR